QPLLDAVLKLLPSPLDVPPVEAQTEAGDLGAVLDRAQGVSLRRTGGLGARSTFAIHGLSEKRVRLFIDGLPADAMGLSQDPASLPVQLIEAVEIYKGVVPIRFGGDALGGALNLVTRRDWPEDHLDLSVQAGAFGTLRSSAVGRLMLAPDAGLFLDLEVFQDQTDNDYPVQVLIPDAQGRPREETVRRFHDAYAARGLTATVGATGRRWADRLALTVFGNRADKDLQHSVTMSVPYGDITQREARVGARVHYRRAPRPGSPWGAEVLASHAQLEQGWADVSQNQWSWRGEVVRARPFPGERGRGERLEGTGHVTAGRLGLSWAPQPAHRLEVSATPQLSAVDRRFVPVAANRKVREEAFSLLKVVSGVSWRAEAWGGRLANDLFGKHYHARPEGPPPATGEAPAVRRHAYGGGDALRFTLVDHLHLKAAYEWAVRLPDPRELFGDGVLLEATPGLKDERSHNLNLGLELTRMRTPLGALEGSAHLFQRWTRDLIILVPTLDTARYQNVADVDTRGVEAGVRWTVAQALTLSANGTWLRAVNESDNGQFGRFRGDRMPNQPYLFGALGAAVHQPLPALGLDRVRLYWHGRYVHEYFLFWESQGRRDTKLKVPTQLTHDLGLTLTAARGRLLATAEVQNLTDEDAFDFFGAQRPGRAFYFKQTAAF
ncbi:MAG: TonB-dependent receptor, partial [Myxococcales bacterium]|nr:TonB-dependent receptor [Myxococcales bacterium]